MASVAEELVKDLASGASKVPLSLPPLSSEQQAIGIPSQLVYLAGLLLAGKLERALRSEAIPDDWNAKAAKVLVSKNYKQFMADNKDKDIFVMFFASWDSRSQKTKPIFEELAEKNKNANLVFAMIDASANDLEEEAFDDYPHLKLYKKDKDAQDYEGPQNLEAIAKFLESGEQNVKAGQAEKRKYEEENEQDVSSTDEGDESWKKDAVDVPSSYLPDEESEVDEGEEGHDAEGEEDEEGQEDESSAPEHEEL